MRRREPPFIGGEEGVIWEMPHPLMEGAKPTFGYIESGQNPMNRLWTGSMNWPNEVRPKATHQGCARTLVGPPWVKFHREFSFDLLEWAYVGFLRSWSDLPWLWAYPPLLWALIYLVKGLLPLGIMLGVCVIVFLVYFQHISCVYLNMSFCKCWITKTHGIY